MEEKSLVSASNSNANLFAFTDVNQAFKFSDMLSRSGIVPDQFKNNAAACLIAVDMAARLRRNPLEVMQNMYVVHGRPGFSAAFLISLINSCGLFERLKFEFSGKPDSDEFGCRAWTIERATGEKLVGPLVTLKMAKDEGWAKNNAAKWRNMPEVMLRYRAASFFSRAYCPDLIGGMYSADDNLEQEVYADTNPQTQHVQPEKLEPKDSTVQAEPAKPLTNEIIEAEILNEATSPATPDKIDPEKKEVSDNSQQDEKMRAEIMKLMKALDMRSDDQAVFFGTHGGNADLNKIKTEGLIKIGQTARAMLDERLGINK
ncbi:MAG: hypothetical protein IJ576_05620 [Synergistaceae bacterium]|nr:hypothetical protein [Synergistaceae bacterium]